MKYYIGVDIGGTNIKIIINDENQTILKRSIKTNSSNNGIYIINDIFNSLKYMFKQNEMDFNNIESIGFAVPGAVFNDIVICCPNIGWENFDLIKEVSSLFNSKINVSCLNDANAAAVAEAFNLKTNNVVFIALGTGVGGGVFNHGIQNGYSGSTGEFGHMHIDDKYNLKCNCGLIGCLETVASATGVSNIYKYKTNNWLSCEEVFNLAMNNDTIAVEVVNEVVDYLARALSQITVCINPKEIVIGGGMAQAGDYLLKQIKISFNKYAFKSVKNTKVSLTSLDNYAGAIGAMIYGKEKR